MTHRAQARRIKRTSSRRKARIRANMPDAEYDELSTFGFSRAEIDSINHVWTTLGAHVLLHPTAQALSLGGYNPSQGLDAINHDLDAKTAEDFIAFGFTAHQGRLISLSDRAYDNMLGEDDQHFDYVLAVDVPSSHLTNVLLLASDPQEVRSMLERYVHATSGVAETHDGVTDTASYLRDALATPAVLQGWVLHRNCCRAPE